MWPGAKHLASNAEMIKRAVKGAKEGRRLTVMVARAHDIVVLDPLVRELCDLAGADHSLIKLRVATP